MLVTVRRCVRRMLISMALAAMTVSLPAERAAAQADAKGEWPQFLGPTRNGLSAETGLLDRWPTDGPKEIWRVPGGVGMSGLAISRGRVLTLVQREGKQWLVALEAKTGESVWETPLAPEYRNPMGNGPRGTPAIAGELVFVFTGEGILSARIRGRQTTLVAQRRQRTLRQRSGVRHGLLTARRRRASDRHGRCFEGNACGVRHEIRQATLDRRQ